MLVRVLINIFQFFYHHHINSIDNIEVYNIIGQRVINLNPKSNSVTINVSGLQNGLYVVKTTVGGSVASSKFVKE